ncbi:redoxin domain-containing protein [Halococcus saccharolyticus]|uniref:Thioredoxin-dependent hydroperoxide peroxidase n=1 Tax=Halococcus saccharolyticus DSM 5350 TaxID=1227455 RepID=M0MGD4_9EURY|nr:redoxin domain-containing protein [Halococcus saccharolyticus]EMA43759.1 thioredoxin-dependent hydroperoxide peroxidase [Halococcus saccharolyticus DSM 5350]
MSIARLDFELPNAGAGPDSLSLDAFADDHDAIVLLFQRDYHCGNCKDQLQDVAERYDEFTERNVAVVSVLPEPKARAREWQESFDLPFPLLADPDTEVGDQYDQPTRFGALGELHDLVGRMPQTVILDTRNDDLDAHSIHEGDSPADRPSIDAILGELDDLLAA